MKSIAVAAAFMAAMLSSAVARAAVLSVVKNVNAGTFTLLNSGSSVGVTKLLVEEIGYGSSGSTSVPGFTVAQVLFGSDPLGCQPDTGSTISIGFCYKETNLALGAPITAASTTFSYNHWGTTPHLCRNLVEHGFQDGDRCTSLCRPKRLIRYVGGQAF